jgi:prepilin-type N-terminal cleavage/methylation domain-containing protein
MMRRAFTLMEILVSVMIFSVVSLALIGVLRTAVLLFRSGETGRAANDETLAALAQLDDDLKRMVPAADGGFLYTTTKDYQGGNMVLAFKIRNPVGGNIGENGLGARLIVAWWVDNDGHLNRNSANAADSQPTLLTESEVAENVYKGTAKHVANGCLYFGVDLSTDDHPRSGLEWSTPLPAGRDVFSTESDASVTPPRPPDIFPTALRITAVLTGGSRNVTTGRVVRAENGDDLRITGVGQIPVHAGAMARLGNPSNTDVEWLTYTSFSRGILACASGRKQRRTDQISNVEGLEITFAPSYSLVRTLPR